MKSSLNKKIWKSEDKINSDVRKNLLKIVSDFITSTKVKNLKIQDIALVGSLANYNWRSKSDLDIHVIFDLTNFERHKKFIVEFLQAKKTIWNDKHAIEMFGHEVEIYPQDKDEEFESGGIYSLIKDEWVKKPEPLSKKKKEMKVDKKHIMKKYQDKVDTILKIEEDSKKKNVNAEKIIGNIEKVVTKLRDERTEALMDEGEMAPENLVYKMLRANGYIDKLKELKHEVYDKDVSLKVETASIPTVLQYVVSSKEPADTLMWTAASKEMAVGIQNELKQKGVNTEMVDSGLKSADGTELPALRLSRSDYPVFHKVIKAYLKKNHQL